MTPPASRVRRGRVRPSSAHEADRPAAPSDGEALARRFHRGGRAGLLETLRRDDSGRWAQLAASVPGAVTFALTHAKLGDATSRAAVEAFVAAVRDGIPFRRAVQPLLEDWSLLGGRVPGRTEGRWRALARISQLPPAERAAQLLRQRLLLRRALPGLNGEHLCVPAPEHLIPEHIPRTPRLQQRWFRVMASMVNAHGNPGAAPEVHEAFLRWLSAHAINLGLKDWPAPAIFLMVVRHRYLVPPGLSLRALVAQVDAFWNAEHVQQQPEVEPPPAELVEFMEGPDDGLPVDPPIRRLPWPELLHQLATSCPDQATRDERRRLDLWLPTPFPGCEEPGLMVRPLRRASELREEGRAMQHCAAHYLEQAVLGQSYFFHVVVRGMPLTVQLRGPEDVAWLEQLQGHRNRAPDPERARLVVDWWQRVARAHGLAPEPPTQPMPDVPF